ncbi:MAG: DUF1311 domain-containing protein [Deltaproteobacteria bacterium]|jgi:uncharacterized protein YecT (DUF1311 family)|nr:DUF1311 domain-containing protein [Deltaproteobacteria bacterium]
MRHIIFSVIAVLSLSASTLLAQDNPEDSLSKQFHECVEMGGVRERIICIGDETERQDARLNTLYKQLFQMESEDRKTMLRSAQRNWIKYKEEWINYVTGLGDGDMLIQETASFTFMMMTVQQADNLQAVIDNHIYLKNNS